MNREDLEHIIRASADITEQYEFVVVGSQSLLAQIPSPEPELIASMEADTYPLQAPELADAIDGASRHDACFCAGPASAARHPPALGQGGLEGNDPLK